MLKEKQTMSKNENVVENGVAEDIDKAVDTSAEGKRPTEAPKEPTREQIIAAYQELSTKFDKLLRAYADLLDLYLGNKPINK